MKQKKEGQIVLFRILLLCAITIALVGSSGTRAGDEPIQLATDWSHRHLIFSAPHSLAQHVRLLSNPRYVQQLVRRSAQQGNPAQWRWLRAPETPDLINGDWSINMGPGATVGAGNYPAKYSFSETTANCGTAASPDFVVYNTSLAGVGSSVAAQQMATFSGSGTPSGSITIAGTLVLTAAGNNSGDNFAVVTDTGTGATTNASRLAAKIVAIGSAVGVTATSSGAVVTITATTAGVVGNSITLSNTVSDLTLAGATLAGGVTAQANIIAYDNLYSGCPSGTVPSTYWAYSTGGSVVTSPALSADGKQLAFVESVGTTANLVLLKWTASATATYNAPATLASQSSAANYRSCTAPCMYTIAFSGAANDTNSSPFYDYSGSDALYVGDDAGNLHKFTGVFNASPAEVTTTGWPVAVSGNKLTSPVYDGAVSKVFVADGNSSSNVGYLYSILPSANPPTQVTSAQLSYGNGVVDGPVVDSMTGEVYIFTADNLSCNSGPPTHSAVLQIPVGFAAGASPATALVGNCNISGILYDGTFDNAYFTGTGNTGNLYVCGNSGAANSTTPTLYQIPMNVAFGSVVNQGPVLAANGNGCGSVSEVYNPNAGPATDWIFTSVQGGAVTGGVINCPSSSSGCIMSFNVTAGTTPTATVGHTSVAGGASGVVVDNTVASGTRAGASQVYFTPLANQTCTTSATSGGCAIQASQSALQ